MSKKKQPLIANPPAQDVSIKFVDMHHKIIEKNKQALMRHDFSEHFCLGNENLEKLFKKSKIGNDKLVIEEESQFKDLFLFLFALLEYGTECWIKDKAFLNKHKETLKLYFGLDIDSEITNDKIKHVQLVYAIVVPIAFSQSSTIDEYLNEEAKLPPLCANLPINEIIDSLNLRIKLLDDFFTRELSPFKDTCTTIDILCETKAKRSKLSLNSFTQSITFLQYDYRPCMSNDKEQYIRVLEKLRTHFKVQAANKFRREWNRKSDTPISSAQELLTRWNEITGCKCNIDNVPKSAPSQYVGILGHNATGIALDSIGRIIEDLFSQGKDRMSQYIAICNFTQAYGRADMASKLAGESVENFSTEEWIIPFINYIEIFKSFLAYPECCDNFSPGGFESLFKEELEKEKETRTKQLEDSYKACCCDSNISDNITMPELAADLRQRLGEIDYCIEFMDEWNGDADIWDFKEATKQLDYFEEEDELGRTDCIFTFPVLEKILNFKSCIETLLNKIDTYMIEINDDKKRGFCFSFKENVNNLKMNVPVLLKYIKIITEYCAKIEDELGTLHDELVAIWEKTDKSKSKKLDKLTGKYEKNKNIIKKNDIENCRKFISDKIKETILDIKSDERKTPSERQNTMREILGRHGNYLSEQDLQEANNIIDEFDKGIVRAEERKKVIADMSHHIKNLVMSVIDPLELLREDDKEHQVVIDSAIRGAELIREIINAMNLSFSGSTEGVIYDFNHPPSDSLQLRDILISGLKNAVSNMFDGKYFSQFRHEYFPGKEKFIEAKQQWQNLDISNIDELEALLGQFFFKVDLKLTNADIPVGNQNSTATKLLIMFQEIMLNAVKYTSFIPQAKREILVNLTVDGSRIMLEVENTFNPKSTVKSSGLGQVIIKNFAALLGAKVDFDIKDGRYKITIAFDFNPEAAKTNAIL